MLKYGFKNFLKNVLKVSLNSFSDVEIFNNTLNREEIDGVLADALKKKFPFATLQMVRFILEKAKEWRNNNPQIHFTHNDPKLLFFIQQQAQNQGLGVTDRSFIPTVLLASEHANKLNV